MLKKTIFKMVDLFSDTFKDVIYWKKKTVAPHIQKGIINKFSETDLTNVNKNAKDFIREKANQSHLFEIAQNQANETIAVIQQLIESVGWELDTNLFVKKSTLKILKPTFVFITAKGI